MIESAGTTVNLDLNPKNPLALYNFNKDIEETRVLVNELIKYKGIVVKRATVSFFLSVEEKPKPIGLTDSFWLSVALGSYSE